MNDSYTFKRLFLINWKSSVEPRFNEVPRDFRNWFVISRFRSIHFIVWLLLPISLKQNWPIRLQDKNNEFQPKPIEPITSRRKTTVKTQKFGIIHCSYHNVIWLASFKWPL